MPTILVFLMLLPLCVSARAQAPVAPSIDDDDNFVRIVFPTFPEELRLRGAHGPVIVEYDLAPSGEVVAARAVSGEERLRALAVEAVNRWAFEPPDPKVTMRPRPIVVTFTEKGQILVDRYPRGCYIGWPASELTIEDDRIVASSGGEGDLREPPIAPTCRVPAEYPRMAKAAKVEGTVIVEVQVGGDGRVQTARSIAGHPLLRMAAEKAALQWTFEPYVVDGAPVEVRGTLNFNFRR